MGFCSLASPWYTVTESQEDILRNQSLYNIHVLQEYHRAREGRGHTAPETEVTAQILVTALCFIYEQIKQHKSKGNKNKQKLL